LTPAPFAKKGLTTGQWRVLILLLVSAWINYLDRGNLSVAAPLLSPELGLTATQMGFLLSSFFWTYAAFQIAGGWLVDRYDVNVVYGLGFLVWSAATLFTGFVGSFAVLLLFRLLLGIGEAVAYPAYSKILCKFPEHQRGFANALIDVGTKAGPAMGLLVGGMLVASYGWRALFITVGLASLLWLPPWFRWGRGERSVAVAAEKAPGILDILRRRAAWATFFGLFCFNYAWYFLLTWLPSYLVKERHFSIKIMAISSALPFCATAVSSLVCGWASDRLIAGGASANRVRKGFAVTGLLICAATLPGSTLPGRAMSMVCMVIAFVSIGLFTSNCWAITQTLAGPTAAGKWTGLQNAVGNLGGVVAPIVTGFIVDRVGLFFLSFVAASVFLLIGAFIYLVVLGPIRAEKWGGASRLATARL
jgi:ACS family D-galactonate transporter-like MFS transporter